MMRVSSTVVSSLAGSSAKPGAISHSTRNGMNRMASAEIAISAAISTESTSSAKRRAASTPLPSSSLAKSGMKAVLNAPSAKSRRNKLGKRKAA
jgi:hypothetical protein